MDKNTPAISTRTTDASSKESVSGQSYRQQEPGSNNGWKPSKSKPEESLVRAIGQAQFLIAYLAKQDNHLEPELLGTLIYSKQLLDEGALTREAEVAFWVAYNELVRALKPVSIESLEESLPPARKIGKAAFWGPEQPLSTASKMIKRYRLVSAFALVLLLITQIYWLIGAEASRGIRNVFQELETASSALVQYEYQEGLKGGGKGSASRRAEEQDPTLTSLDRRHRLLNQLLGTHYELLRKWNSVWETIFFLSPRSAADSALEFESGQEELERKMARLEKGAKGNAKAAGGLEDAQLRFEDGEAGRRFFRNRISAEVALSALQHYLLPLLYGLLGAATYILRQLSISAHKMTFTKSAGVGYRLRLSLGALAGMTIGWFLSPDDVTVLALSPFALAFLVGYNVEILFLLMDKIISSVTEMIGNRPEKEEFAPLAGNREASPEPALESLRARAGTEDPTRAPMGAGA